MPALAASQSSTKRRMAEERLPRGSPAGDRLASMRRRIMAVLTPSARAMRLRPIQKGSSSDMLVEWPAIVTERLTMVTVESPGVT